MGQKAIKERARKQEEAEAIQLQLEYAKMLKEQEEKREKHLVQIQKKQQQKFNALIASTADIGKKAEEDAIRAEKELTRRQKAYDDKERAKKKKLEDEMELCKAAIDEQIKEKMSKIRSDILDDKAYGKKDVADARAVSAGDRGQKGGEEAEAARTERVFAETDSGLRGPQKGAKDGDERD